MEVGLIGSEGFTSLPLLVGYRSSPTRTVVQADGTAYRCDADTLTRLAEQFPILERQLHRFGQSLAMQTTQIAACNWLHDVEERLARWILMSQDRVGSTNLPLTQEFLAQMLGTRRPSVTVSAGILQNAGPDFLHPGKRHRLGPATTRSRSLRLLRSCPAATKGLGSRSEITMCAGPHIHLSSSVPTASVPAQ